MSAARKEQRCLVRDIHVYIHRQGNLKEVLLNKMYCLKDKEKQH